MMRDDDLDRVTGSFAAGLFEGRQVLVSGASSGIGLALARGFAHLSTGDRHVGREARRRGGRSGS